MCDPVVTGCIPTWPLCGIWLPCHNVWHKILDLLHCMGGTTRGMYHSKSQILLIFSHYIYMECCVKYHVMIDQVIWSREIQKSKIVLMDLWSHEGRCLTLSSGTDEDIMVIVTFYIPDKACLPLLSCVYYQPSKPAIHSTCNQYIRRWASGSIVYYLLPWLSQFTECWQVINIIL